MKRQGTMQLTEADGVSETDETTSVSGYLISIEYYQYLEIEFEKERKNIDTI